MITMNELVDLRMQQHIAQEIYRQQIMQRIPDPFPQILQMPMPRHVLMPPRITLPGVEVSLQNNDLWKQFHEIGTEMIITKSGRRMFPSMRLSLSGLEEDSNYCVLLEMAPIGDCRYKYSGSQWVPAGGVEPQSPQRMYLHPDSPASGAHWQAQPIFFNKVKLTNNTLDNNGHIVLASMHKYQPRIHVIHTSDLTQIPWAPQQAFVFPETEFVAVTAYQNDRITKLKIDNNPFAKGFRETGQSRCKRKMSLSPSDEDQGQTATSSSRPHYHKQQHNDMSSTKSKLTAASDSGSSICSVLDKTSSLCTPSASEAFAAGSNTATGTDTVPLRIIVDEDGPRIKRMRSNGSSACSSSSLDDATGHGVRETSSPQTLHDAVFHTPTSIVATGSNSSDSSSGSVSRPCDGIGSRNHQQHQHMPHGGTSAFMQHLHQNMQTLLRPSLVDLACSYFARPQPIYPPQQSQPQPQPFLYLSQHASTLMLPNRHLSELLPMTGMEWPNVMVDAASTSTANATMMTSESLSTDSELLQLHPEDGDGTKSVAPTRKKGFSISAILGGTS